MEDFRRDWGWGCYGNDTVKKSIDRDFTDLWESWKKCDRDIENKL